MQFICILITCLLKHLCRYWLLQHKAYDLSLSTGGKDNNFCLAIVKISPPPPQRTDISSPPTHNTMISLTYIMLPSSLPFMQCYAFLLFHNITT